MKKDKIENLIMQKSESTQEIYKTIYDKFSWDNEKNDELYNDDFISTLSYNCTIIWIEDILDTQSFYVPLFRIKKKEIKAMSKDYDGMEYIDYPDRYWYVDTEEMQTKFHGWIVQHQPLAGINRG